MSTIFLTDLINRKFEVRVDAISLISVNDGLYAGTAKAIVRIDGENHAVRETPAQIDALKEAAK